MHNLRRGCDMDRTTGPQSRARSGRGFYFQPAHYLPMTPGKLFSILHVYHRLSSGLRCPKARKL